MNLALDGVELAVEVELHLLAVCVKSFFELGHGALPRATFIAAQGFRSDGEDVSEQIIVIVRLSLNSNDVVRKNFDLFLECRLVLNLGDSSECVAHDGDQHVQEGNLSDESGRDEDSPD